MNVQQLIKDCKKGNRQAEKALFLHFAPKVLSLCRRYITDKHRAQDLLQECFIQVFDKIQKYDPNKGDFGGWLFRVSTNVVLKSLRSSKNQLPVIYLEEIPNEAEITEEEFDLISKQDLLSGIAELPVGYRTVLNLFIFENWSHLEISNSLNISQGASRSQLARAKKLLKSKLEKKINISYAKGLV